MKVVVAGGSGFLGSHVVERLQVDGHDVAILARGRRAAPEGVTLVRCDLGRQPLPMGALEGAQAIVNLAGIKREAGTQTFEAVHVEATRRLLEAARALGVRRFVHVSVVCSRPDPRSGYHETKWRAEELIRGSGLPFTILKPGVIYGSGDDMLTHLIKMIRFAPVFPVVGQGRSLLQPVDVRDVAEAVAAALLSPTAAGQSYDIVGPERVPLREVVRRVAEGIGLPVAILPTPIPILRQAVRLMDAATSRPLSTPAQLQMLIDGLVGDPAPARRDLGLEPRAFTAEPARSVEGAIPPLFGFSLRLAPTRDHREWLRRFRPWWGRAVGVAVLACVLLPILSLLLQNVWYRMAASAAVMIPAAMWAVRLGWRELYRPARWHLPAGLLAAAALYAAGAVVTRGILFLPGAPAQVAAPYRWPSLVPEALVLPLLVFIILGEEIVWRNAVTLPFAARFGPLGGSVAAGAAFAAAHLSLGMPVLLLAAFAAGTFWSAMVVRTRSALPALVCHIAWDLAVMMWWPYAAG
jgi:uncharacterized protein YbjT (DUF2867 family)/membrane protease YdiL (CAAX protease family)